MAETQAQKEARWKSEGYEKVGNVWVKPGTKAYDDAVALVEQRQAAYSDAAYRNSDEGKQAAIDADRARRADPNGTKTGADFLLNTVDKARENASNEIAAQNKAKAPVDTFDATLQELARARTQLEMAATNGRSGSVQGIGTFGNVAERSNDRIRAATVKRPGEKDPNRRQRTMSAFNLPLINASRGLLR